jgi:hypothetical protein
MPSSASSSSSRGLWLVLAWTACCSWSSSSHGVHAIATDLALDVTLRHDYHHAEDGSTSTTTYTILASRALFGPLPRMTAAQNSPGVLRRPPPDNALLCDPIRTTDVASYPADSLLLVPRGVCTFQTKVYHAQQLGAQAALIYGSLASRYGLNVTQDDDHQKDHKDHKDATVEDITWPQAWEDYDCTKGQAYLAADTLSFDPLPYNGVHNDPLLAGDTSHNLCQRRSPDLLVSCPSRACLLTGATRENDPSQYQACCAWDLHIYLYGSATTDKEEDAVTIPAAYLTMQQGQALLAQMDTQAHVGATLSARWRPHYNVSSMLIWAMGVAAATLASYLSAADYRVFMDQTLRRRAAPASLGGGGAVPRTTAPIQEELTVWHALSFIVMASASLLILFYFQIYSFVKIMYALGCSKAVSSILLDPLLKVAMTKCGVSNQVVWRTATEDFGDITTRDIWAHMLGYALGLAWIIVAFCVRHPDTLTFFWVTQDVFGVCKSDHGPHRPLRLGRALPC